MPEEDGPVELHEPARLRDRSSCKKDRDRERLSRSKRRRGDRLMHGSNRDDGGEESTEESVNDDEDDEDDDGAGPVRMLPQSNPSSFISMSNNHHQPRKSFPPAKVFRPAPPWKAADEMIGVSVPRKARSGMYMEDDFCVYIWTSFPIYYLFRMLNLFIRLCFQPLRRGPMNAGFRAVQSPASRYTGKPPLLLSDRVFLRPRHHRRLQSLHLRLMFP